MSTKASHALEQVSSSVVFNMTFVVRGFLCASLLLAADLCLHITAAESGDSNYILQEVEISPNTDKPVRIFTPDDLRRYDGSVSKVSFIFRFCFLERKYEKNIKMSTSPGLFTAHTLLF